MAKQIVDEEWRPVSGYEGRYSVSNTGRVRREDCVDSKGRRRRGMELYPVLRCGYPSVSLSRNGKKKITHVHRLVAAAFLSGHRDGMQVNHIDGVKTHVSVDNLEWVTRRENMRHAFDSGLIVALRGESQPNSKLKESQVVEIRGLARLGHTYRSVAAKFGISTSTVYRIVSGRGWKHVPDQD